ncbi:Polysaccharide biosynthesis protein [Microbulbifer aggregans]|uniref:Polysaccharide biosynthesis protein n=2 Tax=Microbulbifer aggregans TaxID=1769779 RepID=A0A1C9W7T1_9GAMM|nr:Polysaccharide biosynthesis protein [Microbulbifer aggregans]
MSKFASAGFSFVFVWSVAFVLDTRTAGIFLYSYMLVTVLVQLARAGTENSMLRIIQSTDDRVETISKLVVFLVYVAGMTIIFGGMLFALVGLGIIQIYQDTQASQSLWLLLVLALLFGVSQVFGSYFQIQRNVYSQYWSLAIFVSFAGCLASALVYFGQSEVDVVQYTLTFLLISMLCFGITLLLLWHSLGKKCSKEKRHEELVNAKGIQVIKSTMPFALLTFIHITTQWGGQLLSGGWLKEEELAMLSVATRLAMLTNFVFLALAALLAPSYSKLYEENKINQFEAISLRSVGLSTLFSLTLILIFIVFGKAILAFFGAEYQAAYWALVILSAGWLVCVIVGPTSEILLMTDRTREVRKSLIVSSIITVILSLILIPLFRVEGAAIAGALGLTALSLQNYAKVKKAYGINFLSPKSQAAQLGSIWQMFFVQGWRLNKRNV